MSDNKDKWVLFKNYIHNELGISKEDIRMWVTEAVYEVAERFVHNNLSEDKFNQHIDRMTSKLIAEIGGEPKEITRVWGSRNLKELIAEQVFKNVKVEVRLK